MRGQKRDRDRKVDQKNASGSHLAQRLELGLHDELVFAELATARVRTLDPLLQTGLVDEAQAARAVARRDQGTLIPFTVANPVEAEGQESVLGGAGRRERREERGTLLRRKTKMLIHAELLVKDSELGQG